jgi:hypothetical protein
MVRAEEAFEGEKNHADRRDFMKTCSEWLAGTLFPGVLWAQAQAQGAKITKEMIENASAAGWTPIADDYKMMLENLNDQAKGVEIRAAYPKFQGTGTALRSSAGNEV